MDNETAHLGFVAPGDGRPAATCGRVHQPADENPSRRLAAVAFLDVVGSTRLMELDEDATLRAWIGLRRGVVEPRVNAWRGRVVNLTGDGLLAEFRSVLDAVRWSLDLQAALSLVVVGEPSMLVRIAIHLGDVVEADDGVIYGHSVNIAARLQEYAAPGGIAVSQGVHEQVRHRLAYDAVDLGLLSLKNIARPVRAFRVAPAAWREDGQVAVAVVCNAVDLHAAALCPETLLPDAELGVCHAAELTG